MPDPDKPAPAPSAPVAPAPVAAGKVAFEEWAKKKALLVWQLNAVKALRSWPIGFEVSEQDFDAAVKELLTHVHR